jgi:hypothetical protein
MTLSEQNKEQPVQESVQENVEENDLDLQFATSTAHDYIASAFQALSAVDDMDTAIMSKADEMRIKRIKRKSILIIENCIDELYSEIFEDEIE